MQRLFVIAWSAVVILAIGFCALIFVSLIPHFTVIGWVATGVVIVLLCCIAVLIVAFTWMQLGVWGHRRRTIIAGDVVAYVDGGEIIHLSAELEEARAPQQAPRALPEPKTGPDEETVLRLYDNGNSLRDIAKMLETSYYQVQQITSKKRRSIGDQSANQAV